MQRRMPGVVYPDPLPAPSGPPPVADSSDEHSMALRFVRTAFDPPLPDPFADWIITLHRTLRDGGGADTVVTIPQAITDLGFTFEHGMHPADYSTTMLLRDALRLFGREDLLHDAHPGRHGHEGSTALAAALAAYAVRSQVTVRRNAGGCVLLLTDDQAQHLADLLIPVEGSPEDDLAIALELLEEFVHGPRPTPCELDHHGHCQEHHDDFAGQTRFAQQEGHALLVKHNVRQAP